MLQGQRLGRTPKELSEPTTAAPKRMAKKQCTMMRLLSSIPGRKFTEERAMETEARLFSLSVPSL
eukprot:CAMPEP_0197633288 /NCGR_PEP_ID=MMETSP1338-20131121/9694_1 /TAXON_ID=43686 ORGANISM="Pelagodinium beii, Strain RCC1491" /NCGR_SAMPLE_ID=MMETSP1338 /ASSEMBLY_ACC=CAM_ASM_000754 /LENGTH=64 /DNA_ID=CAMNT_0043204925 /DNA_START=482 /DNA_END=672 /DNA_ORIENTATION=+